MTFKAPGYSGAQEDASLLAAYPTLLVGVGATVAAYLENTAALLQAYEARLLPITRVAAVMDGTVRCLTSAAAGAAGMDPGQSLAILLGEILAESNLESTRESGLQVGVYRQTLLCRIVLVLEDEGGAESQGIFEMLRDAANTLRQPLPLRLSVVSLTTGERQGELGVPLRERLERARSENLEPVNVVVLDRFRSDGSSLGRASAEGREELRSVLGYLLFASLLPAAASEHWLFQSPAATGGSCPSHTLGVGLLVVPLPQIENALALHLGAELLALLPQRQGATSSLLKPFRVEEKLDERALWERLYDGIPVSSLSTEDPSREKFVLELLQGEVRLDLTRQHWARWEALLADYNEKWGAITVPRWTARIDQTATGLLHELNAMLSEALDAAVAPGAGATAHLGEALPHLQDLLGAWTCTEGVAAETVPDPNLDGYRNMLRKALAEMPNSWALGARCLLLLVLEAYAALALARLGWTLGGSAGALSAGVVGLAAGTVTCWQAKREWHEAREKVFEARDRFLEAIVRKCAGVLRAHGLRRLQDLQRHLLGRLERDEEHLQALRARLDSVGAVLQGEAAGVSLRSSSLVQPVIRTASELKQVRDDLWGGTDLRIHVPALLHALPAAGCAGLLSLGETRPSEMESTPGRGADDPEPTPPRDPLAGVVRTAARGLLRERFALDRLRSLGYYYRLPGRFAESRDRGEWLEERVRQLAEQASRLLWPHADTRGSRSWQLLPSEDEEIQRIAAAAHPEQPTRVLVPGILGTVARQKVELPDDQH